MGGQAGIDGRSKNNERSKKTVNALLLYIALFSAARIKKERSSQKDNVMYQKGSWRVKNTLCA